MLRSLQYVSLDQLLARCPELESGETRKIAAEHVYGPNKTQTHSWSPDSAWVAYTRVTETYFQPRDPALTE